MKLRHDRNDCRCTSAPSFVATKETTSTNYSSTHSFRVLPETEDPKKNLQLPPKKNCSSDKNEDHNEQSETSNLHQSSCRGDSTFYLRSAMYRWCTHHLQNASKKLHYFNRFCSIDWLFFGMDITNVCHSNERDTRLSSHSPSVYMVKNQPPRPRCRILTGASYIHLGRLGRHGGCRTSHTLYLNTRVCWLDTKKCENTERMQKTVVKSRLY